MMKKTVLFFLAITLFLVSCTPGNSYYYRNEEKTFTQLRNDGVNYIKNIYDDDTVYSDTSHYFWSSDGITEEIIFTYYSEKLKHDVKVKYTKTQTNFSDEDLKDIKYGYWEPSSNYYFYVNDNPVETIYCDTVNDWFDDYKIFVVPENAYIPIKTNDKNLSEEQFYTKYKKELLEGFKIYIAVYYSDTDCDQQTEAFLWDLNRRCRNIEPNSEYTYLYDLELYYMATEEELTVLNDTAFDVNVNSKKYYSMDKKNILDYWSWSQQ